MRYWRNKIPNAKIFITKKNNYFFINLKEFWDIEEINYQMLEFLLQKNIFKYNNEFNKSFKGMLGTQTKETYLF